MQSKFQLLQGGGRVFRFKLIHILLAVCVLFPVFITSDLPTLTKAQVIQIPDNNKNQIKEAIGLPLLFIENQGQLDERVKYYIKTAEQTIYLTSNNIIFDLIRNKNTGDANTPNSENERLVFSLEFKGASKDSKIEGLYKDNAIVNYFIGNDPSKWRSNVSTYKEVYCHDIYKDIDLRLYNKEGVLRYDLIVKPGANVADIVFEYNGIDGLAIEAGELLCTTKFGTIKQTQLTMYQQLASGKIDIDGSFILSSNTTYGFEVASYDLNNTLVIDPAISYSTYLDISIYGNGYGIAVDSAGYAYVTGFARQDLPTKNAFQEIYGGGNDAFIIKLSAMGDNLIYSTYLGGAGNDTGMGIAVDAAGCAYVTGWAGSIDFPTKNPTQGENAGGGDIFITKLSASGDSLVYSTYLGGSAWDGGYGIAVDSAGCAYVTGAADSNNFPTTVGSFQEIDPDSRQYYGEAIITKLSASGDSLVYSTYLGGSGFEGGFSIDVDASGYAYVTGQTSSIDFPTHNAFQETRGGEYDAFITKLSPSGNSTIYSTYLGGSGYDTARGGIVIDSSGCAYIAGYTDSNDFPTQNPYQAANAGGDDVFITKLSTEGRSLAYSTYLGGSSYDRGYGIAVDSAGCAYVTGVASQDFPTKNAFQMLYGGGNDAFIIKLSAPGNTLVYSSFIGGTNSEQAFGIVVDDLGYIYVAGNTTSNDFPTTEGALDRSFEGVTDAFVCKIDPSEINPMVDTGNATNITTTSVTLNGNLSSLGTFDNATVSFQWGTYKGIYTSNTTSQLQTATGEFTNNLTDLQPRKTYYYRAKAVGDGTSYGEEKNFTTLCPSIDVTPNSANFSPVIVGDSSMPQIITVTDNGTADLLVGTITLSGANSNQFMIVSDNISNQTITPGNSRMVAVTFIPTSTGSKTAVLSIPSNDPINNPITVALNGIGTTQFSVTTNPATDITTTSVTLNGNLSSLGTYDNATVSFQWGTTSGNYSDNTTAQVLNLPGTFSDNLTGLTPATIYYFRARAAGITIPPTDNEFAAVYGTELSFTAGTTPPTVTTGTGVYVSPTWFYLSGNLTDLGTADTTVTPYIDYWGPAGGTWTLATMNSEGPFSTPTTPLPEEGPQTMPAGTYTFRAKVKGDQSDIWAYGDNATFIFQPSQPLTITTSTNTGTLTLQSNLGNITSLSAIGIQTLPNHPPLLVFPHGLMYCEVSNIIPGSTVTFTITFPVALPSNIQYWKYQPGHGWFQVPITSHNGKTITIQITDGGLGDADNLANGVIVDPGGVAIPAIPTPTPSNPLIGTGAPTSHGSSVAATPPQAPVTLANIHVQSASLSASKVAPGTPVTVTANVANRSAVNGSIRIKLYVNGEEDSSQGIAVESGGNRQIYFTVTRNHPGTYAVYIDGTLAGSFVVDDAIDPNVILYISLSMVFFAFVLGAIMIIRRKSYY